MLTDKKIKEYVENHFESEVGRANATIGIMWAKKENEEEIAELVTALREMNEIVWSNFGIAHPQTTELLKKYTK